MRRATSILVVDDDPAWQELLVQILRPTCPTVVGVDDKEAVAQTAATGYDIITLDITMPNHAGDEIFRHLQRRGVKSFLVVITQLEADDARVEYFRRNDVPVFFKDDVVCDPSALSAALRGAVFKEAYELCALIADDDAEKRELYTTCLSEMGLVDVDAASCVRTASTKLEARAFDIVVVDLLFRSDAGHLYPGGREILERWATMGRQGRALVVLITSHADAAEELGSVPEHFAHFRLATSDGVSELGNYVATAVRHWRGECE